MEWTLWGSLTAVARSWVTTNPERYAMITASPLSQHGNVFTFVLFGRRMTVALGPKGSNLILGGKLSEVSAEEAYTVRAP